MKINRIRSFCFSKCYDLISVGPYANRVAKTVSELKKQPISTLTVEEQNTIVQPSLASVSSPSIMINQQNYEFSDIQMAVGIRQINPDQSYIVLKNGKKYFYKQLVYSGYPTDWKGFDQISVESQKNKDCHSFIYDDMDYSNIQQLFARRSGKAIFTVPKDLHFGYQNYFMMLLKSRMNKKRMKAPQGLDPVQVTIICQGSNLVPFNTQYNNLLEKYLSENEIKVLKNEQYDIDYKKKQLKAHRSKQTLKFNSIFHYLPLRVPQVLTNAKINPFQVNRHTLNNIKYQNIFILGNVVNNAYSMGAMDEMSKIISQNVVYNNLGIRKKVIYQGYSSFNIWINDQQCHYIQTDYNNSRLKRSIGESKMARRLVAFHKRNTLPSFCQLKINQSCQIFSPFNKPQTIFTTRNQVPAIIDKNQVSPVPAISS